MRVQVDCWNSKTKAESFHNEKVSFYGDIKGVQVCVRQFSRAPHPLPGKWNSVGKKLL